MDRPQYFLLADANRSLLIALQALEAAGKDGVIRHPFTGMKSESGP
jgi:polyphosphate kinase 2 (PPK2 family)